MIETYGNVGDRKDEVIVKCLERLEKRNLNMNKPQLVFNNRNISIFEYICIGKEQNFDSPIFNLLISYAD